MTMPYEYAHASEEFETFLLAAMERSGLATRNQVYTMTDGVFTAFRRRLHLKEAILFAGTLPPVLRALFVAEWNTEEGPVPFSDRTTMTKEAQSLRADHNFAPSSCIRDVAMALRQVVDEAAFDRALASIGEAAADFWSTD